MRNFPLIELGELMLSKGKSVDPAKHPNEQFELFSISAYDEGKAEILHGKEIGSSKKELMPNDIVLSRIVPHIRRCWVIPDSNGKRQIGSGEWVVFRSTRIIPAYLRYFLMSDIVNSLIMLTVKGVGGSLLRSDPKQIAKIQIPLPPLPIQERIAAILDAADTLRQKDQALLKKYDDLAQSLFLDMVGGYLNDDSCYSEMKKFPFIELGELMLAKGKSIDPFKHQDERFELFSISAYDKGKAEILLGKEIGSSKKELKPNDIVLSRIVPHIRRCWVIPKSNSMRQIGSGEWVVFRSNKIKPSYLRYFLMSDIVNSLIMLTVKGVGGSLLRSDPKQIAKFQIPIPPIDVQNEFAFKITIIEKQKEQVQDNIKKSEALFQSLLQRAFKGELVSEENLIPQ